MTARAGRRPLPARPADTPRPAFRPARFSGIAGYRLQSRELTSCVPADEPEAQIRHPIVIGETLGECLVTGLQVMLVVTHRLTLRQGPCTVPKLDSWQLTCCFVFARLLCGTR